MPKRCLQLLISSIACNDRETVVKCGGRYDQVRLRKRNASLAAFLDKKAPPEHHVLGNVKDALLEHRADFVRQPLFEFGSLNGVFDHLYAVSDLGKRYGAHEQLVQRLRRDERDDARFGAGPAELGNNVGIEQPTAHRLTSRTSMLERRGAISRSRCGDA